MKSNKSESHGPCGRCKMGKQVEGERGKKRGAGPPPFGCFLLCLPSPLTPAMQAKDRKAKLNVQWGGSRNF